MANPFPFSAGAVLTAAQMNSVSEWTSYTPQWTSSGTQPVIGDGVLLGKYLRINKFIMAEMTLITGGTTTFGTGQYRLSLPITAKAPLWNYANAGMGRIFDASAVQAYWTAALFFAGATTYVAFTTSFGTVTNTVPMTWGVSDELTVQVMYEAA